MKIKLLAIFLLTFSAFLHAKDIYLLDEDGEIQRTYLNLYNQGQLIKGDRIFLNNEGRFVTYLSKLGAGKSTVVLKVEDELSSTPVALRLPFESDLLSFKESKEFITLSIFGRAELEKRNVPIPQFYESHGNHYNLVEIIDHDFDLLSFLVNPQKIKNSSKELLDKAQSALIRFAKQTASFSSIGDFHQQQLVYSIKNDAWTLLDWSGTHSIAIRDDIFPHFHSDLFDNRYEINTNQSEVKTNFLKIFKINKTREKTEREMQIYEDIWSATKFERKRLLNENEIIVEKMIRNLEKAHSTEEVLEILKLTPANLMMPHISNLQNLYFDNLLKKDFMKDLTFDQLLEIKDLLSFTASYEFVRFFTSSFFAIRDLNQLALFLDSHSMSVLKDYSIYILQEFLAQNIQNIATDENINLLTDQNRKWLKETRIITDPDIGVKIFGYETFRGILKKPCSQLLKLLKNAFRQ